MKQKSSIKNRILQYINYKKISKYEFYKKTGITRGILDQESGITETNILKFIHTYPQVNIIWLIVGNGDMLNIDTDPNADLSSSHSAIASPNSHKDQGSKYPLIPLIPIEHLSSFLVKDPAAQNIEYQTDYIETIFSDADFYTRVRNLSLFPLYNSGDVIACKIIAPNDFIQWNKIYLLSTSQGTIVNRILQGKNENYYKLSSDNPSFHEFEISRDEINAMAIVKGGIHLE